MSRGRSRRERAADDGRAEAASVAQRIAVMLQAGVAADTAWNHAAQGSTAATKIVERIRAARRPGSGAIVEAVATQGPAWREFAAAWQVAAAVGAPLADTLRAFAGALRDGVETIDDVRVSLAEPSSTARLMLWLPAVGVLLGASLGFDTLGVLTTDPRGIACLIVGVALILAARHWTRVLVRRATPPMAMPGARADLLAIALSGGASIDRATELVDHALEGRGGADPTADRHIDVASILALSRNAGVPAVELLRAEATEARRRARVGGRAAAAGLSTRLLLPLGVCTLPAFMLLGIAPLMLSVLIQSDVPI